MKTKTATIGCVAVLFFFVGGVVAEGQSHSWYAGSWDSTIYNRAERPRTIGVRIDVVDAETRLPVRGAQVMFSGEYLERDLGRSGKEVGIPRDPQRRTFALTAESGEDGVVVFGLGWNKEYPWRRGIDDIEKVQRVEIRHLTYRYHKRAMDFRHLLDVGQDLESQMQSPQVFRRFEEAWVAEMTRRGVHFCVLDLGVRFRDFQNKNCRHPAFFDKLRQQDYGTTYDRPYNFFAKGRHPQSECGPYFAYRLVALLEPLGSRVELVHRHEPIHRDAKPRPKPYSDRPTSRTRSPNRRTENDQRKAAPNITEPARREKELSFGRKSSVEKDPFGIAVVTLTDSIRRRMGLRAGTHGVVITFVRPGSHADRAGLRPGQVINSIQHRVVTNKSDYESKTAGLRSGDQKTVGIWRKRSDRWEWDSVVSYIY